MVDEILKERGNRYGAFKDHADITQEFKKIMYNSPSWKLMSNDKKQAMEMFADKIARILNGDPEYDDSWIDIVGYAQLIVNELHQEENVHDDDMDSIKYMYNELNEPQKIRKELVINHDFDTDMNEWVYANYYFPKLMKSRLTGIEVLFMKPKEGYVTGKTKKVGNKKGKYYDTFDMDYFYEI